MQAKIYTLSKDDFLFWITKNETTMDMLNQMIKDKKFLNKLKIEKDRTIKKQVSEGNLVQEEVAVNLPNTSVTLEDKNLPELINKNNLKVTYNRI
jgi:hypothetical protein